ncbi:hypothetical protein EYS14_15180 [Alteromonadaceae bacterium M269]|nr:hypothetical protein EYS14_15180 [Alteromonadaceae bacterium M269]
MSHHVETEAVIATVDHYLKGLKDVDTAKGHLEAAFYSSTNLHTLDENGGLQFIPRDALIDYAMSGELPDHKSEILTVEVTHDMAFAKIHLDMPDRDFYDYLTLLKLKSGWRIVSKTFTTIMK